MIAKCETDNQGEISLSQCVKETTLGADVASSSPTIEKEMRGEPYSGKNLRRRIHYISKSGWKKFYKIIPN